MKVRCLLLLLFYTYGTVLQAAGGVLTEDTLEANFNYKHSEFLPLNNGFLSDKFGHISRHRDNDNSNDSLLVAANWLSASNSGAPGFDESQSIILRSDDDTISGENNLEWMNQRLKQSVSQLMSSNLQLAAVQSYTHDLKPATKLELGHVLVRVAEAVKSY